MKEHALKCLYKSSNADMRHRVEKTMTLREIVTNDCCIMNDF